MNKEMDMPRYGVFQDGGRYDDLGTLCEAIGLAEELMGGIPVGECSTFTVERDGRLLASVTNRRITGTFHKEYFRIFLAALHSKRKIFIYKNIFREEFLFKHYRFHRALIQKLFHMEKEFSDTLPGNG